MPRKEPDFWLDLEVVSYPGGTTTLYRFSQKPMYKPTFIDPRVKVGGWSEFTISLSSTKGGDSAAVLTVDFEDSDALLRQIAAQIGRDAYARIFTKFQFLSRAGRIPGLAPRVIHRGFLNRRPQAQTRRKSQLVTTDAIGSTWFATNPERLLQTFIPTREWAEGAGLINSPSALFETPLWTYIGEHSDAAKEHPIGTRPSFYLGDVIKSETGTVVPPGTRTVTVVPPPDLYSVEVVGTPGSRQYVAAVVAQFDNNLRTALSTVYTLTDAPNVLDGTNYVLRKYRAPAGWESYYEQHLTGIYMVGRDGTSTYLDIGRHAVNGDGLPDWSTGGLADGQYADDNDHDVQKDLPQINTAQVITEVPGDPTTVTTDTLTGVWAVGIGWLEIHGLFGPQRVVTDDKPTRVQIPFDDPEVEVPSTWVEMGPADDLVRLTVHYATGWMRAKVLSGEFSFATNGCGLTENGETWGIPVTEADEGFILVYNELVLKNGGKGYRNGSFGPIEEFPDGVSVLNTRVIREWHDTTINGSRPRGLQMQLCIDGARTLREFDQWYDDSFFTTHGPMVNTGQIGVWSLAQFNITTLVGYPRYRYKIEIAGGLPAAEDCDALIENLLRAKFGYNPDKREFEGDIYTLKDDDSIQMYGQRPAVPDGGALECRCTRDPETIKYAMGWRLYHNKIEPVIQSIPTDLIGMEQDNSVYCVTHPDGPYEDEPFFLIGKTFRTNLPNPGNVLRGRSLARPIAEISESSILGLGTTIPFTIGA